MLRRESECLKYRKVTKHLVTERKEGARSKKGRQEDEGWAERGGRAGRRRRTLRTRADLQEGLLRRVRRASAEQQGEGREEETQGGEGTLAPRPPSRLTPRVGPEGHCPVALHQVRSLEAVFVLETPVWRPGRGARGTSSRRVASHAVAPGEATKRQQ